MGGLVAIALIGVLLYLHRRRRNRRATIPHDDIKTAELSGNPKAKVPDAAVELDAATIPHTHHSN